MPYKVFVAGEEALAADANAYLMSQTVPRFTNATQRTSQLTAPVLNQLSMLDTRPSVTQYWNGSNWIDAYPFIQRGFAQPTTAADGFGVVTFPIAYSAAPSVIPTPIRAGGAGSAIAAMGIGAVTATNFQVAQSGIGAGVPLNVLWVAIGDR